ncbi:MAG: ABC transporter substrate-binding protein [Candidatus Omnitrophica bacterium]|nr:ABC transporter substrate-binding protein [Candidatus Omnitrophota bacterium]
MKEKGSKFKKICFLYIVFYFLTFHLSAYSQNKPLERIISLGPSITEELYLLGAGDRIVGVTTYCKRPPQVIKKEKVGTVIEVNVEKIFSLKPDLVIATSLTKQKDVEKLKKLGIKVIVFPAAKNFAQLCEQFLELGKIIGKEKEAKEIIEAANKAINYISEKIKNLDRPKVLVQIGSRPLWVATKDSFIGDLIEFAGGKNIKTTKEGLFSKEQVVIENPDVIIITTMGITGEKEKENWQRYKTINAVKNNRIYIIDSYKLCSPTPVSFVETLEELVNILHPNIYEK